MEIKTLRLIITSFSPDMANSVYGNYQEHYLFSANNLRFTFIADLVFQNYLADRVCCDFSLERIFYAVDFSANVYINTTAFKGKVAFFHGAVFENKIFAVAERLSSNNAAVYEGKVF